MNSTSKRRKDNSDNFQELLFKPASGSWSIPRSFPNLSDVKSIGIDTETRDPYLLERGPGFIRGDAEVVGISVATTDRGWYFPIGHVGGGNMEREPVIRWLQDLLRNPSLYVVGANLQYDLEALWSLDIEPDVRLLDIQIAAGLIDEERSDGYSLESLCNEYLGKGKDESLLKQAADAYGVNPKSGLWKLPSKYVGEYAEFDAWAPLQILEKQMVQIRNEELEEIFELESKVLPILWKMRLQGFRVDLEKAARLEAKLLNEETVIRDKLLHDYGAKIDEWSGPQLASICDRLGIKYPRTEKGNPSFTGDYLATAEHDLLRRVADIRELNRLRTTFVKDWIGKNQLRGRIHPRWHQLKGDEGGARTGRMSASDPNPQQVPSRSDLAKLVRELFIPDDGHDWAKLDYSQQEPRILAHFAYLCKLTGSQLIRQAYHQNKDMDIYQFLADSCNMKRKDAKDATLGRMYGMGEKTFAARQGLTREQAKQKLAEFDESVPFVKEIADLCANTAQRRGSIKTLLGRRRHFNLWERARYTEDFDPPLPLNLARIKWPNEKLRRAYTHKALNSLIQGSAADMTKAAMVLIYEEQGQIPYLAVHDELDYGVTSQGEAEVLKDLCETCVSLEVPIKAELQLGKHWK